MRFASHLQLLNSLYGVLANEHFLFFLIQNAESITSTGQVINKWTSLRVNNLLNELLGTEDVDFVVTNDTDSGYFELKRFIEPLGLTGKSEDEIADSLDEFVETVMKPKIKEYTEELRDYLNNPVDKMVWEREVISPSSVFVAKKRYVMLVKDSEGVRYKESKMKIVGLESKKSSTPAWARGMLEQCYRFALGKDEASFLDYLDTARDEFKKRSVEEIALPSGVNGIEKYATSDWTYIKGTPKHVKAAINYNRLIKAHKLDRLPPIKSGGNLKYLTLKTPNPIGDNVIGFEGKLPEEFGLHAYVDFDEAFHRGFEKPLENFVKAIDWKTERIVSLF